MPHMELIFPYAAFSHGFKYALVNLTSLLSYWTGIEKMSNAHSAIILVGYSYYMVHRGVCLTAHIQ